MQDALIGQRRLPPHAQENAGRGHYVKLAVAHDAVQIAFFIIYRSDFAAVQVGLGRRNPQDMGQQAQGGVILEIAELPEY